APRPPSPRRASPDSPKPSLPRPPPSRPAAGDPSPENVTSHDVAIPHVALASVPAGRTALNATLHAVGKAWLSPPPSQGERRAGCWRLARHGAPLHRGRRTDWGRQDDPDASLDRAFQRAPDPRGGGGEPLPLQLLRGPRQVRLPDADLLPAQPLPAAAGALPAGALQQPHGQRLHVRQGPDLRAPQPRPERDGPL